jgi:cytochrome c peroxidase
MTVAGAALQRQEPIEPISATPDLDPARTALGERLFNDVLLSGSRTHSCATCHPIDRGGMDALAVAVGPHGTPGQRNTPTVFNASLNPSLNWDGAMSTLEEHADRIIPRLMEITWPQLLGRLRNDREYHAAFSAAYPAGVTHENIVNAVTNFERSLVTPGSRFDRHLLGDPSALTAREKEGYELFKVYGCASCHQGVNVGGNMYARFRVFPTVASPGFPVRDAGRFLVTNVPRDEHVFRVPSLRNVALTAPYFHDGHARTLETAVATMGEAQLGRKLSEENIRSIVAFLRTLTGEYRGRLLSLPGSDGP